MLPGAGLGEPTGLWVKVPPLLGRVQGAEAASPGKDAVWHRCGIRAVTPVTGAASAI